MGHNPATDLALIKIEADHLCYIPFGNNDSARIGQLVLAIGNPSNLAYKVVGDLQRYGYVQRAYLGVNITKVMAQSARWLGLTEVKWQNMSQVVRDCATAQAGLRKGDILLSVNGVEVYSFAVMMEELGRFSPGDWVEIGYLRSGQHSTAQAQLLNSHGTTEVIRHPPLIPQNRPPHFCLSYSTLFTLYSTLLPLFVSRSEHYCEMNSFPIRYSQCMEYQKYTFSFKKNYICCSFLRKKC